MIITILFSLSFLNSCGLYVTVTLSRLDIKMTNFKAYRRWQKEEGGRI